MLHVLSGGVVDVYADEIFVISVNVIHALVCLVLMSYVHRVAILRAVFYVICCMLNVCGFVFVVVRLPRSMEGKAITPIFSSL